MKVIFVRPSRSRGYITVGVSGREGEKKSLTVSEADYADIGAPMTGDELSFADYTCAASSDERYRARIAALRILSYADNNERTLLRKLTAHGISRTVAEQTAREMAGHGYIDEHRQLLRLVEREANTALSGPRKIRAKLASKGYRTEDIDAATDELVNEGTVDFDRSAELLKAKKLTRGATEEEIKQLLYKNGYNI